MLRTVPLQSLLDWLSKPKGPNLVEASVAAVSDKALALAVTKRMLYGEKPPLVGVGLVYKLHYISTVPFSAAYMHLNVWHSAGSNEESEDRLNASHLLFVNISEMSDVIPVAVQHPVLLDVAIKEAMEGTGEPMSLLSFRGFRLHTIWTQQPEGELAHQIPFPHFLGESISSLLKYESEKFPQGLKQGQKMAVSLRPPSEDHWNIASDLVLPLTLDTSRQQRKAKWAAQGLEGKSKGAKVSPIEAPSLVESPQIEVGGSGEALPKRTAFHREHVLETTHEILVCVHALCIQTMHEMGSVQELDQTLAQTLLAESVRVQLIIGEDFTKSLIALCTDLEASSEVLLSDIARTLNLHPSDPASLQVKATLQQFQWATSLKVNLPLMELQAAWEDMEEFLQSHLHEISSKTESQELIEGLTQKLLAHASWVQELVQVRELAEMEVSQQVLIGLAMDQPLKANFFPGILEGLAGRLGLVPPGITDPPTLVRAGMSQQWAATLREAVRKMEGRDVDFEQVTCTVVPPGLHLDYDLDFKTRRVDDIAPTLTSPLLSGLVDNIHHLEKPEIPRRPTSFEGDEGLWGHGWAPPKPDVPGPSHDDGMAPRMPVGEGEVLEMSPVTKERAIRISLLLSLTWSK